jgi:hypothetical protein
MGTVPTLIYSFALLVCFVVQYFGDMRCITEAAGHLHWSVKSIRWSPLAPFGPRNGWERCYVVRIEAQHGRSSTRTCRVTGLVGLSMEALFDPATVDATLPPRRTRSWNDVS